MSHLDLPWICQSPSMVSCIDDPVLSSFFGGYGTAAIAANLGPRKRCARTSAFGRAEKTFRGCRPGGPTRPSEFDRASE